MQAPKPTDARAEAPKPTDARAEASRPPTPTGTAAASTPLPGPVPFPGQLTCLCFLALVVRDLVILAYSRDWQAFKEIGEKLIRTAANCCPREVAPRIIPVLEEALAALLEPPNLSGGPARGDRARLAAGILGALWQTVEKAEGLARQWEDLIIRARAFGPFDLKGRLFFSAHDAALTIVAETLERVWRIAKPSALFRIAGEIIPFEPEPFVTAYPALVRYFTTEAFDDRDQTLDAGLVQELEALQAAAASTAADAPPGAAAAVLLLEEAAAVLLLEEALAKLTGRAKNPAGRSQGTPLAEAEIKVREWLAANAKDNPAAITRDAVAKGTGVSGSTVSRTAAWKAFRERRDEEKKRSVREVPLTNTMLAVISSDREKCKEPDALIEEQETEEAEQERRYKCH